MRFVLTIDCNNAAFVDPVYPGEDGDRRDEVARILRDAAERVMDGDAGNLRDINGNTVGSWAFEGVAGDSPAFDFGWSELCEEDPDDEGYCAYHRGFCTEAGREGRP